MHKITNTYTQDWYHSCYVVHSELGKAIGLSVKQWKGGGKNEYKFYTNTEAMWMSEWNLMNKIIN